MASWPLLPLIVSPLSLPRSVVAPEPSLITTGPLATAPNPALSLLFGSSLPLYMGGAAAGPSFVPLIVILTVVGVPSTLVTL